MFYGPGSPINLIYWTGYRPSSSKDLFPLFTTEVHGNPARLLANRSQTRIQQADLALFFFVSGCLKPTFLLGSVELFIGSLHFRREVSASDFSFLWFMISLTRVYLIPAPLFTSVRNSKKIWICILPGFLGWVSPVSTPVFFLFRFCFSRQRCLQVNWWGNIPQWSLI